MKSFRFRLIVASDRSSSNYEIVVNLFQFSLDSVKVKIHTTKNRRTNDGISMSRTVVDGFKPRLNDCLFKAICYSSLLLFIIRFIIFVNVFII